MASVAAALPAKRDQQTTGHSEAPRTKIPKASEVTLLEPKPQRTAQRPGNAPVVLCVYKYSDDASDIWEGKEGSLWQIQIEHEAKPSITFGIIDSFNNFLRQAGNESLPTTLADLEQNAGIKVVITKDDPEAVGFVRWRIAFYVAGALENFMALLDDFFIYKMRETEKNFEVHVHPHVSVAIEKKDDLEFEHYVFHEPASALPLGIFEAAPPYSKKIVTVHLQPEGDTLSVLVTNTWSYRAGFDAAGIAGAYFAEGANRKYYRVIQNISLADTAQKQRVIDMFSGVLKNLAVRVELSSEPEQDTAMAAFVKQLREIPSLHFDTAANSSTPAAKQ